jgi:hypothetical protein
LLTKKFHVFNHFGKNRGHDAWNQLIKTMIPTQAINTPIIKSMIVEGNNDNKSNVPGSAKNIVIK